MPLQYHPGQIEVQEEANTRRVADMLASWVGPVAEFAAVADLILLANADEGGSLRFTAVSGRAPLVEVVGPGTMLIPALASATAAEGRLAGGIAIALSQLRRARINGWLRPSDAGCLLEAEEAFTNCRKYVAPSIAIEDGVRVGPAASEAVSFDDPWLADVLLRAETCFLASVSPAGQPDVSHRGGPPGFLSYDGEVRRLSWSEFVGDGMLKSAGNVRATATSTLLVLDLDTGDAAELVGRAAYQTLRTQKEARTDALQQHREHFPVQGSIAMDLSEARRLPALMAPRKRLEKALRVTSCSTEDEQAPQ